MPEPLNKRQKAVKRQGEQRKALKGDQAALLVSYKKLQKDPAFLDLMKNVNDFIKYHQKLAQDGIGYTIKSVDGKTVQEEKHFTPSERTGHLDKAAGIQEIIDFVGRKFQKLEPPKPVEDVE